jgi:hypothetical protein
VRREISDTWTLVGETDRDVDAHRCRTRKAVQQLYEGGGDERVREPPVVEHDRNPAAAAGIDTGNNRHATIVAASCSRIWKLPENAKSCEPEGPQDLTRRLSHRRPGMSSRAGSPVPRLS